MNQQAVKKHMSTRDIILAGILLAAGTVIRMFMPKLPVTPNFIIAMYCLVILLVRPRLLEALAIAIVAAILSMLTGAAPVPFINFASEPIGCFVCYLLTKPRYRLAIGNFGLKSFLVTFLSTIASGTTFVLILSFALMSQGKAAKYLMIYTVVLPTAAANAVIALIAYEPLRRVLRIKDPDAKA